MKDVKDAESLAIDILTFLTGISSRDGEKFPVLRKAVRTVSQNQNHGLLQVIEELRKEDTAVSRNIADHPQELLICYNDLVKRMYFAVITRKGVIITRDK